MLLYTINKLIVQNIHFNFFRKGRKMRIHTLPILGYTLFSSFIAILLGLIFSLSAEAQGYHLGQRGHYGGHGFHSGRHHGGFGLHFGRHHGGHHGGFGLHSRHHYSPHYRYRYKHHSPHNYYNRFRHHRSFSFHDRPHGLFEPDYDHNSGRDHSGSLSNIHRGSKTHDFKNYDSHESGVGRHSNYNTNTQDHHSDNTFSSGWDYFAHGEYDRAQQVFGSEAEANPQAGLPKLGYALSVAISGNLDRGVWGMKRVYRFGPEALNFIPTNEQIVDKIEEFILQEQRPKGAHE